MTRPFAHATAEQVMASVDAVVARNGPATPEYVAEFSELTIDQASRALELAVDLGFLSSDAGVFGATGPLARFACTPLQAQKASVLRVLLESYEPFVTFRDRLISTGDASDAAQQTKALLDLDTHREEIKDTLISLGTYSQAIVTEGGGGYAVDGGKFDAALRELSETVGDSAAAELRIRTQIGPDASAKVSREDVIVPLADAWLLSLNGDPRGAVVRAGNAVESYLSALGAETNTNAVAAAPGINAKLDKFNGVLPKKQIAVGKYLGNLRNAADHGTDSDAGGAWKIRGASAIEFVHVATSFIESTTAFIARKTLVI